MIEFGRCTVLHKVVGQADALHRAGEIVVGQEFENGRADTAFAHTVFKSDEAPVGARHVEDEGFVERFGKAKVDVGDAQVRAMASAATLPIGPNERRATSPCPSRRPSLSKRPRPTSMVSSEQRQSTSRPPPRG